MTLALGVVGAVVGGALGALALSGLSVAVRNPRAVELVPFAAGFGGVLGFVLAPTAAWTLMRHVPLWRAILETAIGTAVGVAIGCVVGPTLGRALLWPLAFGVAGFLAAALRLRLTHRAPRRAVSGPDVPLD